MKKFFIRILTILMFISFAQVSHIEAEDIVEVSSEQEIIEIINNKEKEVSLSLKNDITLTDTLVVPKDKIVTLFLNNNVLTTISKDPALSTDGLLIDGTFNLYDKIDKTRDKGRIKSSTTVKNDMLVSAGRVVSVSPTGTFNFFNGIISNGYDEFAGGGVYNQGTFNMYGSKYLGLHEHFDGALIESCDTHFAGGGIYNGGIFNMYGGLIQNCSGHVGGGLYCFRGSKSNIEMATIVYNYASETGGGIYCDYESELVINNYGIKDKYVLIDSNSAAYIGGGIALSPDDEVKLIGNIQITNNKAPSSAGIANGAGVDNLEIGGDFICMGNHASEEKSQNNIGIFSDSTIKIVEPLGNESEIGFHMDSLSEGSSVVSSGVMKDYKLYADFEGDTLIVENGKASLDLKKYIVEFDTKGGSKVPNQMVERGRYVKDVSTPYKNDYEFSNWQVEEEGILVDVDIDLLKINRDVTFYARWNYPIIEGANSKWAKNDTDDIVIISNGSFDKCQGISIDYVLHSKEEIIDTPELFELTKTSKGNTCLVIKKKFLDTLEIKNHLVRFVFEDDMRSETTLSIIEASVPAIPLTPATPIKPITPVKPVIPVKPYVTHVTPYVAPNTFVK